MKLISEINGSGLFAQSALSASYDSLGNEITATYATKSEIPSLDGLMETDKLEFDSNNKITAYNGSAFAGQGGGGSTYTTDDTEYLNIDNTDSTINFTDKTKNAIDNVPTGTNYDLVGGENIKFTVDDTEHQIVIDVEAPLSTYQIFEYGTASAQQTIDCWKSGKIPVLRIPGYSALLWPCRLPVLDPTTLTTAHYQYFGCNYNASSFTAYLYSTNSRSSGLFTACNQSTYTSYTANANKWLSAVSSQSANWNTVSSLSADKEDKITFGYNDGKIVSMNGSALSAGSNYEGISPIVVDNEAKTIGANTRSVGMQTFSHDDSLLHSETDDEYALGVNGDVVALNSNFEVSNGKITAYNGTPFAGGLSQVVTSEPITGNGTTESPIGANTVDVNYQEITHDDSLVHTSNNAQYALGVNVPYMKWLMGVDTKDLWTGTLTALDTEITLNDDITNYDKIEFWFGGGNDVKLIVTIIPVANERVCFIHGGGVTATHISWIVGIFADRVFKFTTGRDYNFGTSTTWTTPTITSGLYTGNFTLTKIKGVHRKEWNGGN